MTRKNIPITNHGSIFAAIANFAGIKYLNCPGAECESGKQTGKRQKGAYLRLFIDEPVDILVASRYGGQPGIESWPIAPRMKPANIPEIPQAA